jgi:hypothetical protein
VHDSSTDFELIVGHDYPGNRSKLSRPITQPSPEGSIARPSRMEASEFGLIGDLTAKNMHRPVTAMGVNRPLTCGLVL